MVGRYAIAKNAESAGAFNFGDPPRLHRKMCEKRRLLNISGSSLKSVDIARGRRNFIPFWILRRKISVESTEDFWFERRRHLVAHLLQRWP